MARPHVFALLVLLPALAGCTSSNDDRDANSQPDAAAKGAHLGTGAAPAFRTPIIIDATRAGGEPVIAITLKGTVMVAAHPGYTHVHPVAGAVPPTGPEAIVPTTGQSYMWRSADGGATWKVVTLLPIENPPNAGPRGVGQGVSDPDFTVAPNGRIFLTDLEALASASVSWSDDDGVTWLEGNNDAAGGVVDRQWLASYKDTVYFRGNGVNDVRKSEDGGTTWTNVGTAGCGGDIVANPLNGHLVVGCGGGFSISTDGGVTWDVKSSGVGFGGPIESEPAIDSAGTIYIGADPARQDIVLTFTKDLGETWGNISLKKFFPEIQNGTMLWPWTSAGSDGRVSVTFYGSPAPTAYEGTEALWYVYNAIILNATGPSPEVYPTKVTVNAIHKGGLCQNGTICQASTATDPNSDRRMGDFFETTIDYQGFLHIVYSDTQAKPDDVISHVGYARLDGGPLLVVGPPVPGFPTQG